MRYINRLFTYLLTYFLLKSKKVLITDLLFKYKVKVSINTKQIK